jgi:hypothetical protein
VSYQKEFDNRGQVSLWKTKSDNPKAPVASGHVVAHRDIREGEELDISLWKNTSDNPKAPVMKGKISDKFEKRADRNQPPPADDFDDDIPF